MKYLVVGLGNIGAEYEGTRHNAGFMVVDDFARRNGVFFSEQRYGATAEVSVKGRKIILLKPNTFMNLSGNAVRYWMQKENIQLENLLVIVDDLALPFGALGLGNDYPRGGQIDYVLGNFTSEQQEQMPARLEIAGDMITSFCLAGIQTTMNQFNNK